MDTRAHRNERTPIAGTSKMLMPGSSCKSSVSVTSADTHIREAPRRKAKAKRKLTMSYSKRNKRNMRRKSTQDQSQISDPGDNPDPDNHDDNDNDEVNEIRKSETNSSINEVVRNGNSHKKHKEEFLDDENDDDPESESSDTEDESAEGVYSVETIIAKQQINGVTFYFIKWKGWDESANTWEPIEHLGGCSKLLREFEEREAERRKKKRGSKTARKDIENHDEIAETSQHMKSYGVLPEWPADKEPVSVEGVIHVNGVLTYVVKRKARLNAKTLDRSNAVLVYSESFRNLYPELVISFYESRVLWCNNAKNNTEQAAVAAQMQLFVQNQGSKTGSDIAQDVEVAKKQACLTENSSEGGPDDDGSAMHVDSDVNVNINEQETQAMSEDEDADVLDLNVPHDLDDIDDQILREKQQKVDKFGLPDDTDATTDVSTSIDSDHEYVEMPNYLINNT